MADGKNQARALRIVEIMNDFRTLQQHIAAHIQRLTTNPPDSASAFLDGYVVMRQCATEAQAILAMRFNMGNLGLTPGQIPETEVQRAALQRIVLDSSGRRLQAHKIYLRCAAATRWMQLRAQVLQGEKPNGRHTEPLRRVDQRLREELTQVTDSHVFNDLRAADRRKSYWIDEDPSLERILAWIRTQR